MNKSADAFRTIGEVADELDVPKHVLRFWEGKFPQIKPMKRGGGRRYYRAADVKMVETIDQLVHREGYTLKGAKMALQGGAAKASRPEIAAQPQSAATPVATNFAYRARLIALRTTLVNALHEA